MCEIKAVFIAAVLLLAATGFCIYRVYPEKKVGQHSETKFQIPCENEYKKYPLKGGEFYNLIDEDFVACNCTWLYGGKRCEKCMCWA